MSQASAENTTNPPISRRDVERQIDALIDLLDHLDTDPDLEPSLGFTEHLFNLSQAGPDFAANANSGDDRELDDEREQPVDDEPSLGWLSAGILAEKADQDSWSFWANHDAGSGLEEDQSDDEPDSDGERNLGWANEGAQLGEWFGDHNEAEAGSPEWLAEPPVRKRPTGRKMPDAPTIPASLCTRLTV
ncbi:MAG TPA: hypothetical protein VNQ56_06240 [Pseudolabrys sp.]|nr:hypothetical protein [Pseudolabrys sp.]